MTPPFRRWLARADVRAALAALVVVTLAALVGASGVVAPPGDTGPLAPARVHPLGTDARGRDVLALAVGGAGTAIGLGALGCVASIVAGGLVGALAAWRGRTWDGATGRLVEASGLLPTVVLVALLRAALPGRPAVALLGAVVLVRAAECARIVRAQALRAGAEPWVVAARALGAPPWRLLVRHVVPSAAGALGVAAVHSFAAAVLVETAISYLGWGSGVVSWGDLMADRRPGPVLAGAIPFAATVGALFALAESIRDAADPRRAGLR